MWIGETESRQRPKGYAGRRIRSLCPLLATMNRSVNGALLPAARPAVQQRPGIEKPGLFR